MIGGVDMREILVAFAEKGWNLYEGAKIPKEVYRGPVDNIVDWIKYWIMPAIEDPTDADVASSECSRAKLCHMGPSYTLDGRIIPVARFNANTDPTTGGEARLFRADNFEPRGISMPLGDVAANIRANLSTYDREEVQRKANEGEID